MQVIACAIVVGVVIHVGVHLTCDFPLLVRSSPQEFALIASDLKHKKPTYASLLTSAVGTTGIAMVALMIIAFTLATRSFRKNGVKLPSPLNKVTGFNAFWYSHHLLGLVYILLVAHGTVMLFVYQWYKKTVRKHINTTNMC